MTMVSDKTQLCHPKLPKLASVVQRTCGGPMSRQQVPVLRLRDKRKAQLGQTLYLSAVTVLYIVQTNVNIPGPSCSKFNAVVS